MVQESCHNNSKLEQVVGTYNIQHSVLKIRSFSPCSQITLEHSSISNCILLTLTLLNIWCLHLSWVGMLIWKLHSHFSILWSLNKTCAVSVSAVVFIIGWTNLIRKEPPGLETGASAEARIPVWVPSTSSTTTALGQQRNWWIKLEALNIGREGP